MSPDKDVTGQVDFDVDDIDSECLPLRKCVCGKEFDDWSFVLGFNREWAKECPQCKRKLYWSVAVTVFEVQP